VIIIENMSSRTALINLEIVSDFACPWCFIGKRRLEKAIALRPGLDISVNWLPFQLNPGMPREGRNRLDYYNDKFGPEGVTSFRKTLNEAGSGEGINFCYESDAMAPNTLSAHTLMLWATRDGSIDCEALAEKLFEAHLVACENIGDHDVLLRIAGELGMDQDSVRTRLTSGEDEEQVKQQISQATALGIQGVPFFIINRQYGISGAQPAEVLAAAFDQISCQLP
jgi:predicted DsbA family dithiol-disulfide isomerase